MALGHFIISWKKSAAEAYQRMLPVLSSVPGEILHETIWDVSSDLYGCPSAVKNKLTTLIHLFYTCTLCYKILNNLLQDGLSHNTT